MLSIKRFDNWSIYYGKEINKVVMKELIDKAAVVMEIKRLLAFYSKEIENNKKDPWAMDIAKRDILQEILSFLNTLEVKEADLENLFQALPEKIADEKSHQVYELSIYCFTKMMNDEKVSSAWSEEDKEMIDKIIDYMQPMPIFFESTKGKSGKEYTKEFVKNATKWLKSLKYRCTWKPSDEQIKALKEACDEHWESDGLDPLYTLYENLKKLKGE